jgi:hypothetical protein
MRPAGCSPEFGLFLAAAFWQIQGMTPVVQTGGSRKLPALVLALLLACPGALFCQSEKCKFLFFSDCISFDGLAEINTNILSELALAFTNEKPDFVLFGGDMASWPTLANFQLWTNLMSPVYQAGIPVYPTPGNHDAWNRANFAAVFAPALPANGPPPLDDASYFIATSNVLVLALDGYTLTNPLRINQAWLESVLATNTRPHVFAFSHVPAFKLAHIDCMDDYRPNRDLFWHTLSNAHCRVFLCGHDHSYDHARIDDGDGNPHNDIHQIVGATGGAPFYADSPYDGDNGIWQPLKIYHEAQFGYVAVQVNGEEVQSTFYHRTATNTFAPVDRFSYSLTPPPAISVRLAADRFTLTWPGEGTLQAAPESTGVFADVPGAVSPHVVTNLQGAAMFYRLRLP